MKTNIIILIIIILLGSFLRLFRLDELMGFIGDQGWFYLSARDILVEGKIPLVGVTASFTWLNQGALWTYMLVPMLLLFNFNPIGGAYLSVLFGVLSIFMIYQLGKELFSVKVGLIAAFLLSTSPLAISDSRFPYHTSPLSFFTLVYFYFLYKYLISSKNYLIATSFVLGILYSLELSTMVFWVITMIFVLYARKFDLKLIIFSVIAFLVPIIPMMLHDYISSTGYFQVTAFIRFIKLSFEGGGGGIPIIYISEQLDFYNNRLIFLGSSLFALILSILSIIFILSKSFFIFKSKKINYAFLILTSWIVFSLLGVFAKKDISGAYIPMFYTGIIVSVSLLFFEYIKRFPRYSIFIYFLIGFMGFSNSVIILVRNYNTSGSKDIITYKESKDASREIVKKAKDKNYNLTVIGDGDRFEAYGDHFIYLTWWMGNSPSDNKEKHNIIIEQKNGKIFFHDSEVEKL